MATAMGKRTRTDAQHAVALKALREDYALAASSIEDCIDWSEVTTSAEEEAACPPGTPSATCAFSFQTAPCALCSQQRMETQLQQCHACQGVFCRSCTVQDSAQRRDRVYCTDCWSERELCHPTARASSPDSPQWDSSAMRTSLMRACSLASTASAVCHSTCSSLSPFHNSSSGGCGGPFAAQFAGCGSGGRDSGGRSSRGGSFECMDTCDEPYFQRRYEAPLPFGSLCGSHSPFAVQYTAAVGTHH